MQEMEKLVMDNIAFADGRSFTGTEGVKSDGIAAESIPPQECPVCHKKTLERKYSPKNKSHFWVCSDKECVHPVTGKTLFYDEERKKPLVRQCPTCKTVLTRIYSKKKEQYYWFCPKCDSFVNDDSKKQNTKNKKK